MHLFLRAAKTHETEKKDGTALRSKAERVDRSYNNKSVEFESTVAGPPVHPWRCGTGAGVRQGC